MATPKTVANDLLCCALLTHEPLSKHDAEKTAPIVPERLEELRLLLGGR